MAAVFGPVCSWLALRRARSWAVWFFFGVLLGPIAVGLLLAAPPGRCPSCAAPTRGWPHLCASCGFVFGDPPTVPAEGVGTPGLTLAVATPGTTTGAAPSPRSGGRRGSSTDVARPGDSADPASGQIVDSPETRRATRLGRRATAIPRTTSDGAAAQSLAILGSGVFVGGSDELQI